MNAVRVFLLSSGGILGALAILGFVLVGVGERDLLGQYLLFDQPHNVVHAALAVGALGAGFAPLPERAAKLAALGFGVLYLALGVAGFVNGNLWNVPQRFGWDVHMELGENLAHLILGGWGAYVGTQDPEV